MNAQDAVDALEWPLNLWRRAPHLSTGSLGLDLALGGGWPRGYISELYGGEGSGKTTLAEASARAAGEEAVVTWLYTTAVTSSLFEQESYIFSNVYSDTGVMHVIRTAAESDLVVLDALEGLDIEHPDTKWNTHMVNAVRTDISQHETAVLILAGNYDYNGNGEYAINKVVRGHSAVRVRLDSSLHREYAEVTATVVKNGLAPLPEWPTVTFRMQDGKIDRERELAELGIRAGLITRKRSWFYYEPSNRVRPEKLGQGLDNVVEKLIKAPELSSAIELRIRENHESA